MKRFLLFLGCCLVTAALWSAEAKPSEESVMLFESRKLGVRVPEGFRCMTSKDENGVVNVQLEHAAGRISMDVQFIPDAEGLHASARARRELVNATFGDYAASSSERGLRFEELAPRTGAGTYCVFTDAKLAGQTTLPPGEFLHLTAGVKTWPGVVAIFRLFSDRTDSPDYLAMLTMLRESVQEVPVPLK